MTFDLYVDKIRNALSSDVSHMDPAGTGFFLGLIKIVQRPDSLGLF